MVTPLITKASLDKENMKNYRPVLNLFFILKLMEKVVMCQRNKHMDINSLKETMHYQHIREIAHRHGMSVIIMLMTHNCISDVMLRI